jgi:predicted 2-oxoglutarate/Fe(II)-dependent dioxygenase YbiX
MLLEEIEHMKREIGFEPNDDEDELRQIPEIVLRDHVPELYQTMWFVVKNVLNPIFNAIWQRDCSDPATIQIANYNLKDKKQGSWHHDDSGDISVVVPLNTGKYVGGGTAFHNYGEVAPLPSGHALFFPSFTHLHKGLPVESGDRYLLVFWLNNANRIVELHEQII